MPEKAPIPAFVVEGEPSTVRGAELDSWTVLTQCKQYMEQHGLRCPLLVAQAFHVGRVALQAKKLGLTGLVVPKHLPREFDPSSLQPWTRGKNKWLMREVPGLMYLKFISHKI